MDTECAEEATDVITGGLGADVQLARDLSGRTALLEQPQDLVLPRSQMRDRWERRGILHMLDLTEDADDVTAAFERNRAQLRLDPLTVSVQENAAVLGTRVVSEGRCQTRCTCPHYRRR